LLYSPSRRGIELDLLPWLREHRLPVVAYSPVEQSRLVRDSKLAGFARRHRMAPALAAFAWLLAQEGIVPRGDYSEPSKGRLFS
jgi:diketogulonate reductase-like aldo/keto reductase